MPGSRAPTLTGLSPARPKTKATWCGGAGGSEDGGVGSARGG